jgi:hypothetical protein
VREAVISNSLFVPHALAGALAHATPHVSPPRDGPAEPDAAAAATDDALGRRARC